MGTVVTERLGRVFAYSRDTDNKWDNKRKKNS